MMYQKLEDNKVSNLYNYKVINKTNEEFEVTFKLEGKDGRIQMIGDLTHIESQGVFEGAMFIILDREVLEGVKTNVKIGVYDDDKLIETVKTNFMGPAN